jgi:predicted nucleic acid-binding protein
LNYNLILDTDILIALLKGKSDANKTVQMLEDKGESVATSVVSVYELLKGAHLSSKSQENIAEVQDLLSNIDVLDLTLESCNEASQIYKELARNGNLSGEFDVLIAGIAKANNETIVTRDEHFQRISGLRTNEW